MVEGSMYNCIPMTRVAESGCHYIGTLQMTPEEDEIARLERQIHALRKNQIFDGVEIPYSRGMKPREDLGHTEVAKKNLAPKEFTKILREPIMKAVPKPIVEEGTQGREAGGETVGKAS